MKHNRAVYIQELIRLAKYGIVGLMNTGVSAVVMWVLSLTGMDYSLYSAIGYVVGMANSLVMNYRFTFQSQDRAFLPLILKFLVVGVVMILVAEVAQYAVIKRLLGPELLGVAVGMVIYTLGGFVLNRIWVFKKVKGAVDGQAN